MRSVRGTGWIICGLLCLGTSAADGRDAANGDASEAEPSLRLTPEMVRGISRHLTGVMQSRYGLPEKKCDEVTELIARRVMQTAHGINKQGAELIQRYIEEQVMNMAEGGGNTFMPPGFGKEFADRVQPLLPAVRDLVRNVGQDVRPMLPMKEQLKLARDLMGVKTGIDGFEQTMKKWSSGEIRDYVNPFSDSNQPIKKDQNGESAPLRDARNSAKKQIDELAVSDWERYVEQFKQFYQLNESQAATADSILREYKDRAAARKRDPQWQTRYYRDRLWLNLFWRIPGRSGHPIRSLLEDDEDQAVAWQQELGDAFKLRLESIPIGSQRKAAEERIAAALNEKGAAEFVAGGVR